MLSKFAVTNYKNFENRIELDLSDSNKYRFNQGCIKDGHINKMILMGKNGAGKTNFGYALFDIVMTLTNQRTDVMQNDEGSFINGDSSSDEAIFEYTFRFGKDVVEYRYKKKNPKIITEELFAVNGDILLDFDYRKKKYELDRIRFKGTSGLIIDSKKLDGTMSYMRFIANNTLQERDSPLMRMMDFANNMLYVRSVDFKTFIGDINAANDNIEKYLIEKNLLRDFRMFLKEVADLDMNLKDVESPSGGKTIVQVFRKKKLLLSPISSSGTRSLELFYYWFRKVEEPSFVFFDEFDANYHFELSENIIRFVMENYGCQVLMTSHNTGLVTTKLMRPDCYYIITPSSIRPIHKLTDRELRECHNLEKLMKAGEFDDS